jgi:SAM-dependent methyltransferase
MPERKLDMWLYYDATHRDHLFCNAINEEKMKQLARVLELDSSTRVLDIACGHAECLVSWAEQFGISGVGVDLSPYAIQHAEKRRSSRVPDADLQILHQGGEDYRADDPFDVAMCVGASWIWNGFEGTLKALISFAKLGGLIVSGEPYWMREPPDEYLKAEGMTRDQFFTLDGCRKVALGLGLGVVWMIGSSLDDWDRYEMDQAASFDRFARERPDHPDLEAIRALRKKADENYLRWGREHLGFATWVFRTPG